MADKPKVGVSRCLLGDAVRYDGDSKPSSIIINELAVLFELVPVCPEVEAGLAIPRPAVQLTGSAESPRMTGRDDDSLDVTDDIERFCDRRIPELAGLAGYIFKSRSPSCGLGTAPLFINGERVSAAEDGLFCRSLRSRYPGIAVIDEIGLEDATSKRAFIDLVEQANS